jgi:hypothetical protein
VADAEAITVPTQVLISGRDLVVDAIPQRVFYERLGSRIKVFETFPGFFHDTLGELEREPVVSAVRAFLLERFDMPLERPSVDALGPFPYTQREADRLREPLSALSFKHLYWRSMRAMLSLAGRFSSGIGIGQRTGFDSGESLDYVYGNEAWGRGVIGRVIDRAYLDAVGWRGIRRRKAHLEAAIREAVEALRESERPVRILDIAAGRGRYVLDALSSAARPDAVELRDHSASNVIAGRALLAERGWADVATYRRADAFHAPATGEGSSSSKGFTLAIVSGLYELYADNEPVRRSLARLGTELVPGALLIYTGQPWHPQLEFIARALTRERDGAPWVMRRRPQAELDALVEAAGFEKISERIDEDGIFTVSVARRRAASAVGASLGVRALMATG